MSFNRGWRARRAAAQARDYHAKHSSNPYREWMRQQRENERRMLQGLLPLTADPEQHREMAEEARERRQRDAILLNTTIDDLEAEAEAQQNIDPKKLN